jgi:hypothetical protein
MKNVFILSMVMSLATICSCQKQDSTAAQELAKRRADLDATGKALNERMDALDQKISSLDAKVNALTEAPKNTASARAIPAPVQERTPDPGQLQAARTQAMQQLPVEMRSYIDDDLRMKAEKESARPESQRQLDRAESQRRKLEISRRAASSSGQSNSSTTSPAAETTLPGSSPAPY